MGNDVEVPLNGQEIPTAIGSVAGSCIGCGFLAMRALREGRPNRAHTGYFEYETEDRKAPRYPFDFSPGETNAYMSGELACFRAAANLPSEIAEAARVRGVSEGEVVADVLRHSRRCKSWIPYEPGLDPRRHVEELKVRAFEEDRKKFATDLANWEQQQADRENKQERRLTQAAIWITLIVGLVQLVAAALTMTKESVGYTWSAALVDFVWKLFR